MFAQWNKHVPQFIANSHISLYKCGCWSSFGIAQGTSCWSWRHLLGAYRVSETNHVVCSGACLRQLLFVVLSLMRSNLTCFFFLIHIDISVFWEENFVLRSRCTFTRICCLFPALFMLSCNYSSQWCSSLFPCHSKSALYI